VSFAGASSAWACLNPERWSVCWCVAITRSSAPPLSFAMFFATGVITSSGSFVRFTTPKSISTWQRVPSGLRKLSR